MECTWRNVCARVSFVLFLTPTSQTRGILGTCLFCLWKCQTQYTSIDELRELLVKTNKSVRRSNGSDVMVENNRVKITVVKKTDSKQIFGDSPPMGQAIEACSVFREGQEFIVGENGDMPEGFCHWAWNDLYKVVTTLKHGGNFPWMKEKGTSVSCCTDGLRPVIFELRRIE